MGLVTWQWYVTYDYQDLSKEWQLRAKYQEMSKSGSKHKR